ncbi:MAG: hypothetical protein EBZ77_05665 [Chitinophagia bacterium]|nr:hypothetical protein [Chitinophagia bacterium]
MLPNLTLDNRYPIISQLYAAINTSNRQALMALLDEQVNRQEFEELSTGGTYTERAQVVDHIMAGRATWADGSCTPMVYFPTPGKVVVTVVVQVRLQGQHQWIKATIADGFVLKNGLITAFHSFNDSKKAFEWAGLSPGAASTGK